MNKFLLESLFKPTGDQPEAIEALTSNLRNGVNEQVLLGVTGSGKTFTMANVIKSLKRPTLVISHNKTLAAQLYQEFRDFFPKNAVSYFVSYYDYYQPEAYIPSSDTYIEKETEINEEIDKLRLAATTNLLTRPDTIIVASVSCIYNIGSPKEYGHFVLELKTGMKILRENILDRLVQLQYDRNDYGFHRGTFRVRGETIDLYPAYEDTATRMIVSGNTLQNIETRDTLTGKLIEKLPGTVIYPAKHYMTDPAKYKKVFEQIRADCGKQVEFFKSHGKMLEAQRIEERVNYDLEMIAEMGYVNGIENYSRYFDGRNPGSPPYSLLDYFDEAVASQGQALRSKSNGWLLFIDESHMTIPQIRGMYNGDRSRKQTLIDYGFRLPAALDNRPLRFDEFMRRIPQTIYVSATPDEWEIDRAEASARNVILSPVIKYGVNSAKDLADRRQQNHVAALDSSSANRRTQNDKINGVVQQLLRPTGLVDPQISIHPTAGQIDDLIKEIETRVNRHERVLVTTLTKRMAEDLAKFLEEKQIKVHYLHSDVATLERTDILADLRAGAYDVIVGINLLREGLDLPEVSLVAILDADKEGFLRSKISLIQTMGRAARHVQGEVILYADVITKSIRESVEEVKRRRDIQLKYNEVHHITPRSIEKPIRKKLVEDEQLEEQNLIEEATSEKLATLTPEDKKKLITRLTKAMREASRDLNFEEAAKLRDLIAKVS